MDWKFWIYFGWGICALIYWGTALRKFEEFSSRNPQAKERANLQFWLRIVCSPILILLGKW